MFGGSTNNPFVGQSSSSSSPFGSHSHSVFGQWSNVAANNNNGLGGQTGSSTIFWGNSNSTGVFGTFGASSSTIPGFGGSSSSSFGGFGQKKPVFGSRTPTQTSPLGSSTTQPSQPAFGIGSTTIFGSSTPASAFSSFGTTRRSTTPEFASTTFSTGSSTGTAFGVSNNAPLFGSTGGASSTPAFAAFSGASSSSPSLSFASTTPAFGQSSSTSRSCMFGAHKSTTPSTVTFGSFGGGGSQVTCYAPTTPEADNSGAVPVGKLESISAMPVYKHKSHEELRWEDYQLRDKAAAAALSSRINFPSPILSQTSSSTLFSNFNVPKQQPPAGSFTTLLQFPPSTSSPTPVITTTPTTVQGSPPAFKFNSSIFNPSSTTSIGPLPLPAAHSSSTKQPNLLSGPSPTLLGQTSSSSTLFSNLYTPKTQHGSFTTSVEFPSSSTPSSFVSSSSLLWTAHSLTTSPTPAFNNSSIFSPSTTSTSIGPAAGTTGSGSGQTTSAFGPTTTSFSPSKMFHNDNPSTGFVNMFSTTPSLSTNMFSTTPSLNPSSTAQSPIFCQNNFEQLSATKSSAVIQPDPAPVATNPFGTLPAMPQMSINGRGVQYGISSMPVLDKPAVAAPVRISSSSLLTSRLHLSQRRTRWLPASKYHPKNDGPKVPFFSTDIDEETDSIPKALVICPRDNPRAFVTCQLKSTFEKASPNPIKDTTTCTVAMKENGNSTFEAAAAIVVYEHGAADIDALMPKLPRGSDYYTEPGIQELTAKETSGRTGFCRHVKDFVVGRHGYGSIKFLGETDVRRLDIESLVQFNDREVIVYMDDSKKPPVGQGLNKPAEVTLLNIKGFDKKTGHQHTQGPKLEKYMEMLKRKAEEQDAEFVSYDPIKGEWKFRVNHF